MKSTLMKLGLGLCGHDLAYRYQVHPATISRTFYACAWCFVLDIKSTDCMARQRSPHEDYAQGFQETFSELCCQIDCVVNWLDRPTNILAWAQTFCSYKHHNTVKYLIGITPQGTVSFISDGWGGIASDTIWCQETWY